MVIEQSFRQLTLPFYTYINIINESSTEIRDRLFDNFEVAMIHLSKNFQLNSNDRLLAKEVRKQNLSVQMIHPTNGFCLPINNT